MSDTSFANHCFQVGRGDWGVYCCTYDDSPPILTVSAGSLGLSLTTKGKHAGDEAVRFAQALLSEAQRFADEMDRLHAAQLPGTDDENATKAAGTDAA